MKQLKVFFPIIVILAISLSLGSCCRGVENEAYITNRTGIFFMIDQRFYIQKVELIGGNKIVDCYNTGYHNYSYGSWYECPAVHLNAGDTVSSFRIFYADKNRSDSLWNGTVTIGYTAEPRYIDGSCSSYDIVLDYTAHISNTTFTIAKLNGSYVSITP